MAGNSYPRLANVFSLDQLPAGLQVLQPAANAVRDVLEKVHYRNLIVQQGSSAFALAASLEIVSYQALRVAAGDSGFTLVLNPEELAANGITTFPLAFSYSLGIRKFLPLFDLQNPPTSADALFDLLCNITGVPDAELISQATLAFETEADATTNPLAKLAQKANTEFGSSHGLAIPTPLSTDEEAAQLQVLTAFATTNPTLPVASALFQLYIADSSPATALEKLDTFFALALGEKPLELVRRLLIPQVSAKAYFSVGVTVPRSLLLPVLRRADGTHIVDPDPTVLATILFVHGIFSFNTQGGFGFDTEIDASLPNSHPRVQLGHTGLQLSFSKAKLDLSENTNIAEANADGRPINFRGFYAKEVAVFLPDSWTLQPGSVSLTATDLLVGTGGLSGKFGVKSGAAATLPNSTLVQARIFQDLLVNFQSFNVTFRQTKVISSDIKGTFSLDTFLGPNGRPAPFAFELTYAADGYQLAFIAPVVNGKAVPVTVSLGSLAEVHFTKLVLGKKGNDWYLDLAANIEVKQALPIIGKALPSKIAITRLRLDTDPASVAITALPTWPDGTRLTVNPREGFSLSRTLNLKILDVLSVERLRLSTRKDADGTLQTLLTFDAALGLTADSTTAQSGPNNPPPGFRAHVTNAGFTAALKPTAEGSGNLALADIRLGIKLPDSAGVSVNAGGLVGSGSLAILDNGNRYEGVLALSYKSLQLAAYGILTQNLPDGGDGPSLLALITAQFKPVQLGLGFTLSAVGGLLGLHRTASTDYLRGLVRSGGLKTLLFPAPKDPGNTQLSDLTATLAVIDAAFPAAEGRYVIGLLAQLGWGVPDNLITLDVALLIELPAPVRLVILGVLKASLPSEDHELLRLRADFLGSVDFGAKQAAFDATLSDSKLWKFTLTGDLAFRLYQGNNPLFVLTAGGFHPAFQPPAGAGLTGLRRLTLALAQGDDRRITLASYFAVTSNTVQFGSHLDLYLRICRGLHVEGHFGFDVLFQFNPFHVLAHVEAGVAIKYGDRELLSLHLSLDVTGPGPWHIWGSASFKVWFVRIHVDVDTTIGPGATEPALPATDVQALLVGALNAAAGWEVEAPKTALPGGVVLRPPAAPAAQFFLDPRGALVLRQRVAPLGLPLEKYGSSAAAPRNGQRFDLTELVVGNDHHAATGGDVEVVRDFFAPDQFRRLTDAQKLSVPSFQQLPCGLRLKSLAGLVADPRATRRVVEYEHKLLDGTSGGAPQPKLKLSGEAFQQLARGGALGQEVQAAQPSARAPRPVGWAEDTYAVVHAATLEFYSADSHTFNSQVEAEEFRKGLVAQQPALEGEVLVVPSYELALA